jgi:hypothetical protein
VKLGQKPGLVMLEQDISMLNVEDLFVADDSIDCTNAGEGRILSLIGIIVRELQVRKS